MSVEGVSSLTGTYATSGEYRQAYLEQLAKLDEKTQEEYINKVNFYRSNTGIDTSAMSRRQKEMYESIFTTEEDQQMNVEDFMLLMVAQLKNQNPMEPMDDLSFMSQMSSFTSLEQMKALSSTMSDFAQQQNLAAAHSYLGKGVQIEPNSGVQAGQTITGTVDEVHQSQAGDTMVVVNGKEYNFKDITAVWEVKSETVTTDTASTEVASTDTTATTTTDVVEDQGEETGTV